MAGIGFELGKLWKQGTYRSMFGAYGITTLMESGPSLFLMITILIICFFTLFATPKTHIVHEFLSTVIYLLSSSMIISAFLQYTFFRFIADSLLTKNFNQMTPNYIGVLLIQLIISVLFSIPFIAYFFPHETPVAKALIEINLIILSLIWVSIVLLSGLKSFRRITWAFVLGYSSMLIAHFITEQNTITYLLSEFLLAQTILFVFLMFSILDFYPSNQFIKFDFLKKGHIFYTLGLSNLCYTLGFWIDKYLFWFNPDTRYAPPHMLYLSPLYDVPLFIAYLSILPTISVFLLHMEARFSTIYPRFMETIFKRKTLAEINAVRTDLILAGRGALFSLFKTQSMIVIILFLSVKTLFSFYGILPIYMNLLLILIVGVGLNVILWGVLSILYYMTQYRHALYVTLTFLISNTLFTWLSFAAGPDYFGYGLSASLLLSLTISLILLNKDFNELEYITFMMTD